jgi:hypothetical protein
MRSAILELSFMLPRLHAIVCETGRHDRSYRSQRASIEDFIPMHERMHDEMPSRAPVELR